MQNVEVLDYLKNLFQAQYCSKNLSNVDAVTFHAHIKSLLGTYDSSMEGYLDGSKQRDLSVKYHWGHNHDFGDGNLYEGRLGWRHLVILSHFISDYGLPLNLTGKKILDIGVWSGGTSMLLVAMGAEVLALEEVSKYSDTVNYLAYAFDIQKKLKCLPKSLYEVLPMFADYFDYIIYSGVVYHVSDPVLSLRLLFSSLKNGGEVFLESYGYNSTESICRYEGPSIIHNGSKELINRGGWNYFVPSSSCLEAWCKDAGFQDTRIGLVDASSRLMGSVRRTQFQDFCRAGVSKHLIR